MAPTAKNYSPRPRLILLVLTLVILFGLMAFLHSWTPRLGLDLRGGTTVTLTARADTAEVGEAASADGGPASTVSPSADPSATAVEPTATPTQASETASADATKNPDDATNSESMELARSIIAERIDSLGVGEASVTVQGNNQIEVSAPNVDSEELVNLVGQTAQLAFRFVYQYDSAESVATTTAAPSTAETTATTEPSEAAETAQRRPAPALPTAIASPRPTAAGANAGMTFNDYLNWAPSEQDQTDFENYKCGADFPDVWDQPLLACSQDNSVKYLLGPVILSGSHLTDAQAGIPSGEVNWVVMLDFDSAGATAFEDATTYLSQQSEPNNMFAIVLDGEVVSSPSVSETISGGSASISGSGITQDSANELATVLRYGALPLAFDISSVDTVSATLGGEQLRAGLIAGLIGLLLVVGYCVLYYRGLSVVVVGSLLVAGAITYGVIVLLGEAVGFALNLPGVAGAIVAIGMTADSFIIYFERIRDDVRDGYSLSHAVESGWHKARGTIVIADCVQLLSAVILFFLAIGSVKGFAFTLMVTTCVDLFMVFFFTKPLMTLLSRLKYFASGRKWSGFDPEHLGVSKDSLIGRRARMSSSRLSVKEA